jgi:monoamine oxidase
MSPRIAIIGGGFSGLIAAHLLEKCLGTDTDTVVFERGERLGGRIITRELGNAGVYYDSGAAEFYDIPGGLNPRTVIGSLGLPTREMIATPFFFFEGDVFRKEEDFLDGLGVEGVESLRNFWELGMSLRSPSQYVLAGHPPDNQHPWLNQSFSDTLDIIEDEKARRFTQIQVHSDVATEPHLTTGIFGFDNLLIDHPDYVRSMFTIVGGNERLIEALARGLSSRVLLSSEVQEVRSQRDGTFEIVFAQGGTTRRFEADFVLATPPPTQLINISWSPGTLATSIKKHIEHHYYPTDYLRATILFRERTWAETFPESYFVTEGLGGVTVYDKTVPYNSGEAPILSLLIAGSHATELSKEPDDQVLQSAMRALPKELGVDERSIIASEIDRWQNDQGVSRMPGGVPLLSLHDRHLPAREHPQLFILGDFLYDTTINGALDGAKFVINSICGKVSGTESDSVAEFVEAEKYAVGSSEDLDPICRPGETLPFVKRIYEHSREA